MYLSNATETLNQCQSKKRHAEETHRTLLNKTQLLKVYPYLIMGHIRVKNLDYEVQG